MTRLLATLLSFICAAPADAFLNNVGGSTAQFLRIGVGTRAAGLGEAYGPIAEGPDAIYWNPAGLARQSDPEIAYSHIEMNSFFHHESISYVHPVRRLRGAIGISATMFYQDSIDLVTNRNAKAGSFTPHSEVITIAYGTSFGVGDDYLANDREYFQDLWYHPHSSKPLDRGNDLWTGNLAVGIAAKLINESIFDEHAVAGALDGGVHFRHAEIQPLTLSFVFRNLGSNPRFREEIERLPVEVAFGAAYDIAWKDRRILPAVEIAIPYYGQPVGKIGVEYSFHLRGENWAALRGGYKSQTAIDLGPMTGIVGGIGFGNKRLAIDFGFQPMDELGATFRASIGWRF